MEIPGVNKKRNKISKGDPENNLWNFHGSWFLVLDLKFQWM